jgi:hypothetical protein
MPEHDLITLFVAPLNTAGIRYCIGGSVAQPIGADWTG